MEYIRKILGYLIEPKEELNNQVTGKEGSKSTPRLGCRSLSLKSIHEQDDTSHASVLLAQEAWIRCT